MELPKPEAFSPQEAVPSTVAYIGYHAAQRPNDLAVIANGREISYSIFYRDIGKMVATLRGFGFVPGNSAAIEIPQRYLHLVVVLACEALGIASLSYEHGEENIVEEAHAIVDLVVCMPGNEPSVAKRVQVVDQPWLDAVFDREAEHPIKVAPIGPNTPLRIVKSSGTTGSYKMMIHTGRVHQHWIEQFRFRTGLNRHSRYLLTANFVVQAFHAHVVTCLRMGGTCIYDDQPDIAESLVTYEITHATFFPFILVNLLDALPKDYVKAEDLTIVTIGAPVSGELRRRLMLRLANDLMEAYGTNEVCAICTMDGNGQGRVLPDVQVEVVDENHRPVLKEPGMVRVMSAGVVSGYINNPQATREMFRDGWFYPGDVAVMEDSRTVELIGRDDDLLNIRGVKFQTRAFEEMLIQDLAVDDACLTIIEDGQGISQVWLAIVLQERDRFNELQQKVAPLLPPLFGKIQLAMFAEIPRTTTGKVQRNKLNLQLKQALSS